MSHPITITINVDAAAAVRVGKGTAGPCKLELDAVMLAHLDPAQRNTLAAHLGDESPRGGERVRWGDPLTMHAPAVGEATLATLAYLLDFRAGKIREQEARDRADQSPLAVQRRIVEAVRGADDAAARKLALAIVELGPRDAVAVVLAATRHPAIRDAMAQIYQVDKLEERPIVTRTLHNPNRSK
jgi:hypothetical protein